MGEAITLQRQNSKIDVQLTLFPLFPAFEKHIGGKFGLNDGVSRKIRLFFVDASFFVWGERRERTLGLDVCGDIMGAAVCCLCECRELHVCFAAISVKRSECGVRLPLLCLCFYFFIT